MKKVLALLLIVSIYTAGCAHTTPNPVLLAQAGDEGKTCDGIVNEMQQMIHAQSVAEADRNKQIAGNVALGVAGAFLIVPWFFMDTGNAATVEQRAAQARYQRLAQMQIDKKCPATPVQTATNDTPANGGATAAQAGALVASTNPQVGSAAPQKADAAPTSVQKLEALDVMLKKGLITQDEYNAKKQEVRRDRDPTQDREAPDSMNHPSHHLFERASRFGSLPPEVANVPHQLQGTSFFPVGVGLFIEKPAPRLPSFPVGGIMALGHDWGTTGDFDYCATRHAERLTTPTWKHLLSFLTMAGIDRTEVFYTNFFVGLRNGLTSMGPHPARRNADFLRHCQDFFVEQVESQKPRLVLVLGVHVPSLIAPLSADLDGWSHPVSFRNLDAQGLAGVPRVKLRGSSHTFAAAVLAHPSYRPRHAKFRRYRGLSGDAAEVSLVRDMLQSSPSHAAPLAA